METIMQINGVVNNFVWGPPGLTLLVGTGIYLTILLKLPQIRYFIPALAEVVRFRKKSEKEKGIPSFAAMATALARWGVDGSCGALMSFRPQEWSVG